MDLPCFIPFIFILSTIYIAAVLYFISNQKQLLTSKSIAFKILFLFIFWAGLQMTLTIQGFYKSGIEQFPPKIFVFGFLPILMAIILMFNTKKGKIYIDSISLQKLHYIHIVRILVEIGLYYLFIEKAIPKIMTFAGLNFDILAGLTVPFVIYFGFIKKHLSNSILLIWNILSLALLLIIIVLAILSAPSTFQQFGFNQPNIAIFSFPFSWLPLVIVPAVIFAHLVAIRQLVKKDDKN